MLKYGQFTMQISSYVVYESDCREASDNVGTYTFV